VQERLTQEFGNEGGGAVGKEQCGIKSEIASGVPNKCRQRKEGNQTGEKENIIVGRGSVKKKLVTLKITEGENDDSRKRKGRGWNSARSHKNGHRSRKRGSVLFSIGSQSERVPGFMVKKKHRGPMRKIGHLYSSKGDQRSGPWEKKGKQRCSQRPAEGVRGSDRT